MRSKRCRLWKNKAMDSDFCLFTLLRLHPHAVTCAGSVGTQEKKDKIKVAEHICYCIRTSEKLSQADIVSSLPRIHMAEKTP